MSGLFNSGNQFLNLFNKGTFISKGYLNGNLIYNGDLVTITINPEPADATIEFSGYTVGIVKGNSILVRKGTSITYTISKEDFVTKTITEVAKETKTVDVDLNKIQCTLTINPTPSNAIVTFNNASGTVSGNSITVDIDTTVEYTVSADKYVSKTQSIVVDSTKSINVSLNKIMYTLTVNPTPSNATVTLTASGYSQSGNSITVPIDTKVTYTVSKTHYVTQTNSISMTSNNTLNINLNRQKYTLTINPTPSDSTVTLTANGATQSGNSITVDSETTVNYTVSRTGYVSKSGSVVADSTRSITVSLTKHNYTFTIIPIPSNATVTLTASGYTQDGNRITVPYQTTVNYTVSAPNCETKTGSVTITETKTLTVELLQFIPSFYYVGRSSSSSHTSNKIYVLNKSNMSIIKIITLPYEFRTSNLRMYFSPETKRLLVLGSNVDNNISYVCIINCMNNTIINQASLSGYSSLFGDYNNQSGLGVIGMAVDDNVSSSSKQFLLVNVKTNKIYKLTSNNVSGYGTTIQITTDTSGQPAIVYIASSSNSTEGDITFYYCYVNNISSDKSITFTSFGSAVGYTSMAMSIHADDYVKNVKYSQIKTFRRTSGTSNTGIVSSFTVVGVNRYKTVNINSTYLASRPCAYLSNGGYYFPYGQTSVATTGANFYYYNSLTDTGSTIAHGYGALNNNGFGVSCGLHTNSNEASNVFDYFLYYGGTGTSTTLRLLCTGNTIKTFTVPQFYSSPWQGLTVSDNKSIYYQNRIDNYVSNSGVIVCVTLANSSSNPVVTQYQIPQECIDLGSHSQFVVSWA